MKTFLLTAIFSLLTFVGGCGSAATNEQPVTNTPVQVVTPVPYRTPPADETASTDTAFDGTAGKTEKKNPQMTGVAVMTEVRTARHDSYDRLVFEFSGGELPPYTIEYIDRPVRACGSGDVVPLDGDGWIEVRFTNTQAHNEQGATIRDRARSPSLPIIKDLKITCDFEAEVAWVAGVSSPNRYRVLELKDPTRLAIDIKHGQK
jgi:hypothetical protein